MHILKRHDLISLGAAALQLAGESPCTQIHIVCQSSDSGGKLTEHHYKARLYSDQFTWEHQQSIYILIYY